MVWTKKGNVNKIAIHMIYVNYHFLCFYAMNCLYFFGNQPSFCSLNTLILRFLVRICVITVYFYIFRLLCFCSKVQSIYFNVIRAFVV